MSQLKYGKHTCTLPAGPHLEIPESSKPMHIEVTSGMSGFFAVCLHWEEDEKFGGFWEPFDTYPERRKTYAEAAEDARKWAALEGLEFKQ